MLGSFSKQFWHVSNTAQKIKFFIKVFFSKCDQIRRNFGFDHIYWKNLKGTLMQIWKSTDALFSHKNNVLKVSHDNTAYFLRCTYLKYMKCLFINRQKLAYVLTKIQTSWVNNSRILRIKNTKKVLLLYELKHIVKFSNLHQWTFNAKLHFCAV